MDGIEMREDALEGRAAEVVGLAVVVVARGVAEEQAAALMAAGQRRRPPRPQRANRWAPRPNR